MCVCVAVFFVISPLISELMSFSSLSPITPSLEDSVWENNTYPHPLTYIYIVTKNIMWVLVSYWIRSGFLTYCFWFNLRHGIEPKTDMPFRKDMPWNKKTCHLGRTSCPVITVPLSKTLNPSLLWWDSLYYKYKESFGYKDCSVTSSTVWGL